MRASPWLPVLLLLALGAYLLPPRAPDAQAAPAPSAARTLPDPLPRETRALFEQTRPATVQVESVDPARNSAGIGTGFFISDQGQVLTAYHVVSTGTLFQVSTVSGRSYRARVTAFNAAADVALLSVDGRGPFPFLKLTTRAPRVGETVLAIGNSGGEFLQPRRGTLLGLDAAAGRADFPQGTLEMSAPLAPGDSGGPIIDGNGQAIGVVSYIRVDGENRTQRSYAVPVVAGNALVEGLLAGRKQDVAVVGLVLDDVHSGMTDPPGAIVSRVARGSPAARAGLRGAQFDKDGNLSRLGDIITSVNGTPVRDADEFITAVRGVGIGVAVRLGYVRDGTPREATVVLAAKASIPDLRD
ncbi:S1-C subfamily serine protease [Deinococcus metalli]|uniref:Serine protease n=1 Tax=Deinococcus metalli TaxID=1141878 RepID=A0A7W8KH52_9DEIO|nr:S1C family serine protease [Deinococcus metalli]MBB5376906.1 S1-C subfamily serine protease [Deinococcus metalli]GHF46226.1 serine protease [Deinococcus metalli]